jgi:hypothetical protein
MVVALNEVVHRAERGNAVTSMDLIDPKSFARKGSVRLDR